MVRGGKRTGITYVVVDADAGGPDGRGLVERVQLRGVVEQQVHDAQLALFVGRGRHDGGCGRRARAFGRRSVRFSRDTNDPELLCAVGGFIGTSRSVDAGGRVTYREKTPSRKERFARAAVAAKDRSSRRRAEKYVRTSHVRRIGK